MKKKNHDIIIIIIIIHAYMRHADSPAGSLDDWNYLLAHTGNYTSQSATRTFQAVKTTTINNVQIFTTNFMCVCFFFFFTFSIVSKKVFQTCVVYLRTH